MRKSASWSILLGATGLIAASWVIPTLLSGQTAPG